MDTAERTTRLLSALDTYRKQVPACYDEVLNEVAAAADKHGSLGKTNIGALIVWKRLNAATPWVFELMSTSDDMVHLTTRIARQRALDDIPVAEAAIAARRQLTSLPGFRIGDAIASAVLCALAPTRMAVYDGRAHAGLRLLDLSLSNQPGRYSRYMELVDRLRNDCAIAGHRVTVREVDLALYTIGRPERS